MQSSKIKIRKDDEKPNRRQTWSKQRNTNYLEGK